MFKTLLILVGFSIAAYSFTADCDIEEWGTGEDGIKKTITIITGNRKLISIIDGKRYESDFYEKTNNGYVYKTGWGFITLGKIKHGKFSYNETVGGDGFIGSCIIRE